MPSGTPRKTKVVDGVQYNQCTKCEEWFPATKEFFHFRSDKQCLHAKCKKCNNEQSRQKRQNHLEEKRAYGRAYGKRDHAKTNRKKWEEANKEKIKAYQKEWREQNKEHVEQYREENQERDRERGRGHYYKNKEQYRKQNEDYMYGKAIYKKYVDKLTVDEAAKPDKKGNLLVKCTYCGRYFVPTNREVLNRISVLNGGKNLYGEARLYCSDNCKKACPVFGQQFYYRGEKNYANREVDPLLRQMALELDNYECQRCGKSIEEIVLHVHHIQSYRRNKMLANDIDNTITFCIDCHLGWMHTKNGYGCVETKCDS